MVPRPVLFSATVGQRSGAAFRAFSDYLIEIRSLDTNGFQWPDQSSCRCPRK